MDRLAPDIFSTLRMKEHVLYRAHAHLKVLDWSLVWNALLTKKLPMFLSRKRFYQYRDHFEVISIYLE